MIERRYERIWIGITPEQYAGIWNAMGGNGRWGLYSTATFPPDQDTTWSLPGRMEPMLKNRTRDGVHSYYLALCQEVDQ